MGILNVTPDSFSDGGKFTQIEAAVGHAKQMVKDGANIIDIGGMSSRPGAEILNSKEELKRILPILDGIKSALPDTIVSIDTVHSSTASTCLDKGANIINDISAFEIDPELLDVVAAYKCPYVLMHMLGTPGNMQIKPKYENVVKDVVYFLGEKINTLIKKQVADIIIDPGFGFGKTLEQNYLLLKGLHYIQTVLEYPLLVGLSRKSMLHKPLNITPLEADFASVSAITLALNEGAQFIRTHNVAATKHALEITQRYHNA